MSDRKDCAVGNPSLNSDFIVSRSRAPQVKMEFTSVSTLTPPIVEVNDADFRYALLLQVRCTGPGLLFRGHGMGTSARTCLSSRSPR